MDLGSAWATFGLFWRNGCAGIILDINRAYEKPQLSAFYFYGLITNLKSVNILILILDNLIRKTYPLCYNTALYSPFTLLSLE